MAVVDAPRTGTARTAASGEFEREMRGGQEFRESTSTEFIGTLHGHFAVFDQWTKINDLGGGFMERIAKGATLDTIREDRPTMKVLVNHGHGMPGLLPIGPILELEEDDHGARYEVGLLDTDYVRPLVPALRHNLFGASFRFAVEEEKVVAQPGKSQWNPNGIEERAIVKMRVREFGPVCFPAYPGASADVRSEQMSAEDLYAFICDPEKRELIEIARRNPMFDAECRTLEAQFAADPAKSADGNSTPMSPQLIAAENARRQNHLRAVRSSSRRAAQSEPATPPDEIKCRAGVAWRDQLRAPKGGGRL